MRVKQPAIFRKPIENYPSSSSRKTFGNRFVKVMRTEVPPLTISMLAGGSLTGNCDEY